VDSFELAHAPISAAYDSAIGQAVRLRGKARKAALDSAYADYCAAVESILNKESV
jgi:hypothetical protein